MNARGRIAGLLVGSLAALGAPGCGSTGDGPSTPQTLSPARSVRSPSGIVRLYGPRLALGSSAEESANAFVHRYATELGVRPEELVRNDDGLELRHALAGELGSLPVGYDRATGAYRFRLFRFGHARNGVPVFGSELRVLVRNAPGFPVVWAASSLRHLGDYVVPSDAQQQLAAARARRPRVEPTASEPPWTDFEGRSLAAAPVDLASTTEPQPVLWAGAAPGAAAPVLAVTYEAATDPAKGQPPQRWTVVADAMTAQVLHRESRIRFVDVEGTVSGLSTSGPSAAECAPEVEVPFPDIEVYVSGGASTYTTANGSFTIANDGTEDVTVVSPYDGRRFVVSNYNGGWGPGATETLSESVTPPGNVAFVHNESNSAEFVRAQANGYVNANQIRGWALSYNPSYPTIANQTGFGVNVNLNDFYCPGNAWYDGSSVNFCIRGGGYGNTSFASVAHHEYGHHLVEVGGSGQQEYGEGMADVVAMLWADEPRLGLGFFYGNCNTPLRTADNDCQYDAWDCSSCGWEIHDCGNLLSGAVWSTREALVVSEPASYLDILSSLALDSILLHLGGSIEPDIVVDWLTLDDDDGTIENGTPHRSEICHGFEAHGLACPPLTTGMVVTPLVAATFIGDVGGPFSPAVHSYSVENLGPGPIQYQVSSTQSWLVLGNASGTLPEGMSTDVSISVTSEAESFTCGDYADTLTFTNTTDHVGDTVRHVALPVGPPELERAYFWPIDTDPGWATSPGWSFGAPQGKGGTAAGNPDPSAGYTGDNVYGFNLYGDYPNGLFLRHLTTPPFDCSGLIGTTLRFQRWLNVDAPSRDHATISVSTDATAWTQVWENPTEITDDHWVEQEVDLGAIADGEPTVYVRWTMGPTDGTVRYSGWNVDDVEIRSRCGADGVGGFGGAGGAAGAAGQGGASSGGSGGADTGGQGGIGGVGGSPGGGQGGVAGAGATAGAGGAGATGGVGGLGGAAVGGDGGTGGAGGSAGQGAAAGHGGSAMGGEGGRAASAGMGGSGGVVPAAPPLPVVRGGCDCALGGSSRGEDRRGASIPPWAGVSLLGLGMLLRRRRARVAR